MSILTRSRLVSLATGAALLASLLSVAPLAQAAALTASQINAITTLLQAFGADPATVANVQAVLDGTATSTASMQMPSGSVSSEGSSQSASGSCAVLSGNLKVGSTGEDVSRLQAFLGKDKSVYPEGTVTGYFGTMTEDAVRRWQAAHNIVTAGTPDSTGFGIVGPHTRSKIDSEMEVECEGGDTGSNQSASSTSSHESGSGDQTASSTSTGDN